MSINTIKYSKTFRVLLAIVNKHFPTFIAKARYKKQMGKPLDLNDPKDINEKILWLSLYSDISQWTRLADKYEVRQYAKELGLEDNLVKLYGRWDKAEDIDWDSLPNSFVLKANNGSGTVQVVEDKSKLDIPQTIAKLNHWLTLKPGVTTSEFHYAGIKPCLIAEELLHNPKSIEEYSSTLIDYKVWCFNGRAYYIWACASRVGESTEVAMFDTDWHYRPEMSVFTKHYKEQKKLVPKPENLSGMIAVAEKLSKDFPVVRVDLYNLDGKIYLGEMTFTSLGGQMDFYTPEALLKMGECIDLSNVKKVRNL